VSRRPHVCSTDQAWWEVIAVHTDPYTFVAVAAITEREGGVLISFAEGGEAVLAKSDPRWEEKLRQFEFVQTNKVAAAVQFTGAAIAEVTGGSRGTVIAMMGQDDAQGGEVAVGFAPSGGFDYLIRSHPRFRQILETLERAYRERRTVWYVMRGGTVLDAQLLPEDRHAALCDALR
jgi:hypothetical protein